MSETTVGYGPVKLIATGAAKIYRVGSEEGGRSWSLEFDPETGRPTEALWQHQRLRVCGQCQDCKHWHGREGKDFRCSQLSTNMVAFMTSPTFGCTEWEAKA